MEVCGKRAENVLQACELCLIEGLSTQADGFCHDCDENMCNKCFQHHLKAKSCRYHVLGPLGQNVLLGKKQSGSNVKCKTHVNENVKYYCLKHDVVTCGDCNVADHSGCKMEFISNLSNKFENSSEFKEIVRHIEKLGTELKENKSQLCSNRKENRETIDAALAEINKFRKDINGHLDKVEEEIRFEGNEIAKQNDDTIDQLENMLTVAEQEIGDIMSNLDATMIQGDTLFIRTKEYRPKLTKLDESVSLIRTKNAIRRFTFEQEKQLAAMVKSDVKLGCIRTDPVTVEEITVMTRVTADTQVEAKQSNLVKEETPILSVTAEKNVEAEQRYLPPDPRARSFDVVSCEKDARDCRRFEEQNSPTNSDIDKPPVPKRATSHEQTGDHSVQSDSSWELNFDDIALEIKIGNGYFGAVFKGVYKRTNKVVAVKTFKDTLPEEERRKFLTEGRILEQYDHPNIVKLFGIAAQRQSLMMILEYMSGGALLAFLQGEGKGQSILKAAQMCVDVACGMAYLSNKRCLHRDLAARNCLVGDNDVVKISGFHISIEGEEYTVPDGFNQIPIKWTAPESMNNGKYTAACDVWSYGVLMWEIFSNGQTPYPDWKNAITREMVDQGYRMPAPANTPDSIYQIMLKCWDANPQTRITFYKVHEQLSAFVKSPPIGEDGLRFEEQNCPTNSVDGKQLLPKRESSRKDIGNHSVQFDSSWELNYDDIVLETRLASGHFGDIFKGVYKKTNEVVAVKTCKDTVTEEQLKEFLWEGHILKQYDHPNIVKFIGIAAQRQPVMSIMEFVPGGTLVCFLRKEGKKQSRIKAALMCVDVACGMAYLSDKRCIHRDLVARNCLVGDNDVVKIAGFGYSREGDEYKVPGVIRIPVKWTAPEALISGKYTAACDVWSYGILMWEIFSNGQTPYPGWTNAIARESVEQGYRMPAPENTPDSIYQIMLKCWDANPQTRITFHKVHEQLSALVKSPPRRETWS